jgi:hypothetical protein
MRVMVILAPSSIRLSSQRLLHPLFLDSLPAPLPNIDLQNLLSDLALQLSHFRLIPAPLSHTGNALPGPWRNSFRHRCRRFGWISKARATSAADDPISSC